MFDVFWTAGVPFTVNSATSQLTYTGSPAFDYDVVANRGWDITVVVADSDVPTVSTMSTNVR